MFKLRDGRECLWQWDIDVQLIVSDPTVTEVHFCNKTDDCSLVCDVFEEDGLRLVNVPNILLQSNWTIRVYAYCTDHTKLEKKFKVTARSKPADYVYTETEVQTWDKLEQRVEALESGGADLSNYYTKEETKALIPDVSGFITEIPDEYLTESELEAKGYITSIPTEYITEETLSTKGFQTEEQVLALIAEHGGGGGNLPASEEAEF